MRRHSPNELNYSGDVLGPDKATRVSGVRLGISPVMRRGKRAEEQQYSTAVTQYVLVMYWKDVDGTVDESCYIVVDGVTYVVDNVLDTGVPQPRTWAEIYCHTIKSGA